MSKQNIGVSTNDSNKRTAIYTICGCGGGEAGPNYSYVRLKELLEDYDIDVYILDTTPKYVTINVAQMMKEIIKRIEDYSNIYLIGWSMGGAVVTQVAYYINNFIRPNYVAGVVYLASQTAQNELFFSLDCSIVLIHGKNDDVINVRASKNSYSKFQGSNKKLILLDNQGHDFSDESSDIAEIMYSLFV